MLVLGIETSCDETGIAVYDSGAGLLANMLHSQIDLHADYGGVVPELASRDHIRKVVPLTRAALAQAGKTLADLSGIAYTAGPGLAGALLVGAGFGRSLAWTLGIPALGVHHMEAHLLAPLMDAAQPPLPFVALLVSGGHTQLVRVDGIGAYALLGESLDDAAGEAFDKAAKMLGLGYPGGPNIARCALDGDPQRFRFPRPMTDRPGLDFSFSGLKTFTLNTVRGLARTSHQPPAADVGAFSPGSARGNPSHENKLSPGSARGNLSHENTLSPGSAAKNPSHENRPGPGSAAGYPPQEDALAPPGSAPSGGLEPLSAQERADIARCFEEAVVDTLAIKCRRAIEQTGLGHLVIAGGVSANLRLRERLESSLSAAVHYAEPALCTDNGAMVAFAGCQRLIAGQQEPLGITTRARWPITSLGSLSSRPTD